MLRWVTRLLPWVIILILVGVMWFSSSGIFNFFKKKDPEIIINQTTILQEIEAMGKLELVKYHFKDVIEFEKKDYSWLPSSKVVIIAGGEAVGCIDLSKIKAKDVLISGDTAIITLPEPELCYFKINHEDSKVYDLQYSYFQDKNLIDQAYKEAEKQLKKAALNLNIITQTKENSEIILKPILEKLTGKKVFFNFNNIPQYRKIDKI